MIPRQWLPVVVIAQHRGIEDLRDVAEPGDLVCAWSLGEELARGGVPKGFFDGEEALALNEGAFYLTVVDGRVDGVSHVLTLLAAAWYEIRVDVDIPS